MINKYINKQLLEYSIFRGFYYNKLQVKQKEIDNERETKRLHIYNIMRLLGRVKDC